jgi:hypothetical protein
MDSKLINAKALELSERSLRLTPGLISWLGLEKKSSHLKMEEFFISCLPFDMSLSKASLLAFLSEAEVVFFSKLPQRAQKLSLTFALPYASKPATFFILCDIKAFRKPASGSPYCFIDVVFRDAPFVLKEILVGYFVEVDEAESFFRQAPDRPLEADQIVAVLGSSKLSLLAKDSPVERLKICRLSPRGLRVFGDFEGVLPGAGEDLAFEPFEGDGSCLLQGRCGPPSPLAEASGYAFLDVDLVFSPRVHLKMKRAVEARGSETATRGQAPS